MKNPSSVRRALRAAAFYIGGLAFVLIAGCNFFGVIANDIGGTQERKAEWIPSKQPTLVLVENYAVTSAGEDVECNRLGAYIMQDLDQNHVVPLVDFNKVLTLRDQNPEGYRKMSVASIGRAVGASQIIYVDIRKLTSETMLGSNSVKWKADASVMVVDANNGRSLWPVDLAGGHPVAAETDFEEADPAHDDVLAQDSLDKNLADQVGKLFHDWMSDTTNDASAQ
jgi:hypothetical protein